MNVHQDGKLLNSLERARNGVTSGDAYLLGY